jgi:hypothetical protein
MQRYSRWNSPRDVQNRRNTAIDKLDALSELDRGASESAVKAYLAHVRATTCARGADEVLGHLESA